MLDILIKKWVELDTKELYQLLQLRSDVFVVEQECAYQDLDGKDMRADHFLVYKNDPKSAQRTLVAYCRSYQELIVEKKYMAIGRVCTHKEYRGLGIARQLMEQTIKVNTKQQALQLTVSAQAYLESFYRSLGFATVSEPYLEDGIAHIRMVRDN